MSNNTSTRSLKNNLKTKLAVGAMSLAAITGGFGLGVKAIADSSTSNAEEVAMMPVWEWAIACVLSGGEFGNGGDAGYYCILDGYVIWY